MGWGADDGLSSIRRADGGTKYLFIVDKNNTTLPKYHCPAISFGVEEIHVSVFIFFPTTKSLSRWRSLRREKKDGETGRDEAPNAFGAQSLVGPRILVDAETRAFSRSEAIAHPPYQPVRCACLSGRQCWQSSSSACSREIAARPSGVSSSLLGRSGYGGDGGSQGKVSRLPVLGRDCLHACGRVGEVIRDRMEIRKESDAGERGPRRYLRITGGAGAVSR